jgi:hypothetical protein
MKSTRQNSLRRLGPENRWTLLFIGDHGRVITLKRFKGMVLAVAAAFILLLIAFSALFWMYLRLSGHHNELNDRIKTAQAQIRELRHEKDILMARVVVAESKLQPPPPAEVEPAPTARPVLKAELPPEASVPPGTEEPSEPPAAEPTPEEPVAAAEASDAGPGEAADAQASATPEVAVEDFKASRDNGGRRVKVSFKVKNIGQRGQRITGHAIVVLQNEQLQAAQWQPLPAVRLTDGKPGGRQKGKAFAIRFFRTMTYEAQISDPKLSFDAAAVYVFSDEGDPLLEKIFKVDLLSPLAGAASPGPAAAGDKLQQAIEEAPGEVGFY